MAAAALALAELSRERAARLVHWNGAWSRSPSQLQLVLHRVPSQRMRRILRFTQRLVPVNPGAFGNSCKYPI